MTHDQRSVSRASVNVPWWEIPEKVRPVDRTLPPELRPGWDELDPDPDGTLREAALGPEPGHGWRRRRER